MDYLYKTHRLVGQVLFVVFLLAVLGAQVVSAQTPLPPCTMSLISELPDDEDAVDQAVDIDKDGDGLIEICDLEGLNEMRYVLNGSGYRTSPTDTINRTGCPSGGNCSGFELTKDLDFTNDDSYRTTANRVIYTVSNYDDDDDSGWQPIGNLDNSFSTRFEGNGHTISNLMINRSTNDIGLFGVTVATANIANIGLLDVRITGGRRVGGLVARNFNGSIANSYVTGSVSGNINVGGLVGTNDGFIMNSYATGSVSGNDGVGGLAGGNGRSITNSYATGSVSGNDRVGGLVGGNGLGLITNSYATGFNQLVGSLSFEQSIMNSSTQTLMALKMLTAATGIYSDWSTAVWDFGTPNDLPTLRSPQEGIRIRTKVFLEGPLQ